MQDSPGVFARHFRHGVVEDFAFLTQMYADARRRMAASGNPTQWGTRHPRPDVILDDLRSGRTILLVDDAAELADGQRRNARGGTQALAGESRLQLLDERHGAHERILAVFAVCEGLDPTYRRIDGAWLDDDPYVAIHRVASSGLARHTARDCFGWCVQEFGNVRVDTHRNNAAMRHILDSCGFTRCGTITIDRGEEHNPTELKRLAYQRHDHDQEPHALRFESMALAGAGHHM